MNVAWTWHLPALRGSQEGGAGHCRDLDSFTVTNLEDDGDSDGESVLLDNSSSSIIRPCLSNIISFYDCSFKKEMKSLIEAGCLIYKHSH